MPIRRWKDRPAPPPSLVALAVVLVATLVAVIASLGRVQHVVVTPGIPPVQRGLPLAAVPLGFICGGLAIHAWRALRRRDLNAARWATVWAILAAMLFGLVSLDRSAWLVAQLARHSVGDIDWAPAPLVPVALSLTIFCLWFARKMAHWRSAVRRHLVGFDQCITRWSEPTDADAATGPPV